MLRFQTSIVAIVLLWATSVCVSFASAQDSAKDQRIVDQVSKSITKAGKLFQEKKYPASAKLIKASEKRLLRLVSRSGDSELRAAIEKQHARLTTAGNLLKKAGVEIEAIAPLPKSTKVSPDTKALPDLNAVSFVNDVAPIIDAKCGRCHVQAARGQFSAKSFSDLMASTTVTPHLKAVSKWRPLNWRRLKSGSLKAPNLMEPIARVRLTSPRPRQRMLKRRRSPKSQRGTRPFLLVSTWPLCLRKIAGAVI